MYAFPMGYANIYFFFKAMFFRKHKHKKFVYIYGEIAYFLTQKIATNPLKSKAHTTFWGVKPL
jgi:hypothetical protein